MKLLRAEIVDDVFTGRACTCALERPQADHTAKDKSNPCPCIQKHPAGCVEGICTMVIITQCHICLVPHALPCCALAQARCPELGGAAPHSLESCAAVGPSIAADVRQPEKHGPKQPESKLDVLARAHGVTQDVAERYLMA